MTNLAMAPLASAFFIPSVLSNALAATSASAALSRDVGAFGAWAPGTGGGMGGVGMGACGERNESMAPFSVRSFLLLL